jgi:hypothetical protein|eukprot:COSAG06_NODE_6553_length_2884_cov_1.354758_2_plen_78_part_00
MMLLALRATRVAAALPRCRSAAPSRPFQRRLCSGPAGSGSTAQPESRGARLRARVLSALQKDGSKELDTSLPLGYGQ